MVFTTIAGIFIVAVVCGVGFGVASADSSDDVAASGAFGFSAATQQATATSGVAQGNSGTAKQLSAAVYEQSCLATTSARTIDAGLDMIARQEREAKRRAKIEAREAARRVAQENEAALQRVKAQKLRQGVSGADGQGLEYGLAAVDWTVGKDAFIEEWAGRIDAYLANTPLVGYGYAFAEAAWDNGVDPRWSPAISNTESSNGAVCFLPYNAWGWGQSSWGDWDSALRAHVMGLGLGYGYSITPDAAVKYCPPNSAHWYSNTLSQMALI